MRINRKKQLGKHAVISGIRMPQLRCTRVSESDILRRASLALCACLLFTAVFVGCGTEASDEPVDPNRLQVMASFYTMYDFAQKIGGEHVQVTCMVPSGTEPHDWEPSTKDITRMEQADVLSITVRGWSTGFRTFWRGFPIKIDFRGSVAGSEPAAQRRGRGRSRP